MRSIRRSRSSLGSSSALRSALFPGYRQYQSAHKGRVFCPTFMRFVRENMNIICQNIYAIRVATRVCHGCLRVEAKRFQGSRRRDFIDEMDGG